MRVQRSSSVGAVGAVGAVLLGAWAVSCQPSSLAGPGPLGGSNTSLGGAQNEVCPNVKRPDEPSVVSWDASALSSLSAAMDNGGVVVRYRVDGCKAELEPLPFCAVKGAKYRYKWSPGTEKIEAKTSQEVFAELPLGAASLSGKVKGGRMLRVDAKVAGVAELPLTVKLDRGSLEGDPASCARATHVVARFILGGFTMVSGESSRVSAKASVFGFGGGGEGESGLTVENSVGQKAACEAAQEKDGQQAGCSFPLRIGLRPLDAATSSATAPTERPTRAAEPSPSTPPDKTAAAPAPRPTAEAMPAPAPPAPRPPESTPSTTKGGAMVFIAGGSFDMGSNDGGEDEKPVHRVKVDGFSMDRTEVTVAAYRACVDAGVCSMNELNKSPTCNWGVSGKDNHPINCVGWGQSEAFCKWAGKRLPTEPEWEFAARGGSQGRKYAWGNEEPTGRACFNRAGEGTCAVGAFPTGASKDGLQDMSGNVWEWTSTPYCKYNANGYVSCNSSTPVYRGGGFLDGASTLRGSFRVGSTPGSRGGNLGFRCARTGR